MTCYRASGNDIEVLSGVLHDSVFDPDAASLDESAKRFRLPVKRLDHAARTRRRFLFLPYWEVPLRQCELQVTGVVRRERGLDRSMLADGERSTFDLLLRLRPRAGGLRLETSFGAILLDCSTAPVVEVVDGDLTSEVGARDFGKGVVDAVGLAKELERLRVRD